MTPGLRDDDDLSEEIDHDATSSFDSESASSVRLELTNESSQQPVTQFELPEPARNPHSSSPLPTQDSQHTLRRRRSSIAQKLISGLGDAGGVNSFNNFARSWSRAAKFNELADSVPRIRVQPDIENQDAADFIKSTTPTSAEGRRSLLHDAIERQGQSPLESPFEDRQGPSDDGSASASFLASDIERRLEERRSSFREESLFSFDPSHASPFAGSPYAGNYGTWGSPRSIVSHSPSRYQAPQVPEVSQAGGEEAPLLPKQSHKDKPRKFDLLSGRSTLPQTVFNSVNTLIGSGMLSLPLAMRYSGWFLGMLFFLFASVATSYTSKLLAKCLNVDNSLLNFADLAYISFGTRARVAVSVLFCLELVAACVALVILFADSMNALIEPVGVTEAKVFCGLVLVPLAFVPLRYLSFSSVLGIICCSTIVITVFTDGMLKSTKPGSLRDPADTFVFPSDWRTLPLAFGLLMAPWGGHSVFPNIYRDMRHPRKYNKAVNTTYVFVYSLEVALAVIGYLMFGDHVRDVVTSNIFRLPGYPPWIDYVIATAIGIIPLTKTPLNARPIFSTFEFFLGLSAASANGVMTWKHRAQVATVRIAVTLVFVVVAICIPSFDRVMALLGSLACSLVCVILPCSFHLKIFGKQLSYKQWILDWSLIAFFTLAGLAGTVCAFLPKHMLGAD